MIKTKNKAIKMGFGEKVWIIAVHLILLLFAIIALYPFLNVVAVSLSGSEYVSKGAISLIPKGLNIEAYKSVLQSESIFTGYKNTIFVAVMTTVFGVFCTAMTAYPLSKKTLPGNKFFLILISITMWFNAGMIPRFLVMKSFGLLDSLTGLVIAHLITGYNVTVMRSFFIDMPPSLEESAKLDGCNDIQVLFRIVLPLSLPSVATIGLWIAVAAWNQFFEPMLLLNSTSKYTLQIFLRDIVVNSNLAANNMEAGTITSDMVKYATIIVATVPVLLAYPFIQKYFVKGRMDGAVKG